jgi:hypothetical protein
MKHWFESKYGISPMYRKIREPHYRLFFPAGVREKFLKLMLPYVGLVPSMNYKFNLKRWGAGLQKYGIWPERKNRREI